MVLRELSEHLSSARLSVSPCSAGPVLVVVVGGEADWVTAGQLRDELTAALAYGPRSLVLDLTELEFCNLQGLRALLAVVTTAQRTGVDVTMYGMSPQLAWLHESVLARRGTDARQRHFPSGSSGSWPRPAAPSAVPFA